MNSGLGFTFDRPLPCLTRVHRAGQSARRSFPEGPQMRAFIFPGQGSQSVGMGAEARRSEQGRKGCVRTRSTRLLGKTSSD